MKLDAESYLKSGSNELRVLEYTVCGHSFGINILKVQKILSRPECLTAAMNSHPAVIGMFKDNNGVIPLVDLGYFLGYEKAESIEGKKIVITEFFNVLNGFIVDTVEWIHHFMWEDVINANDVLRTIDQKYIISIVKPDGERMVPLLDYETIILDLCPELGSTEMRKLSEKNYDGTGLRVLIAEDSPSVRNMMVTELTELGFDVVSAADGREAMAILEKDKNFSLVISDVEMPRMDGLALTTAIRSTPEIADIPVIVYSSIGDIGMKARAEFLKASAHVTKLSVEELMEQVIKLTGGGISDDKIKEAIAAGVGKSVDNTVADASESVGSFDTNNVVAEAQPQAAQESTTTIVAESEHIVTGPQSNTEIEDLLDEKVQELSGKLKQVESIAKTIGSDELDESKTEETQEVSQPKTEITTQNEVEVESKSINTPTLVVEAERVTVASAKEVTIVDAGNVSIDNVRESMPDRQSVLDETVSKSPHKGAGKQKKNQLQKADK